MEKESGKKLDKWDVAVSLSSGALTVGMDALWELLQEQKQERV